MRILFVCHGNICRSPMAEFVMKDLAKRKGMSDCFVIESAATSSEELGNPVHRGTKKCLAQKGISCAGKYARRITRADYHDFDLLIGMDKANIRSMRHVFDNDPEGKVRLLLEFAGRPGAEIADPWYTGNFNETYEDVLAGCEGLMESLGY